MKRTITREFNEAGQVVKETIVEEDDALVGGSTPTYPGWYVPYPCPSPTWSPYTSPTTTCRV